ncbi:Sugar transferase involved in LPS biosynthesis (colanic, teichoic acid) [Palleronia marisminoris]|uniref:Putative sugar transferase EpsL n=1 Tax=Palleronia marisminoris TaxID=315423 RepID=A0A1Y5TU78_9RHOB|nr:sugar transferase [Palleronia marisminoris]SFH50026.1 Sugar transferase involved in LPS biosynthesis (colanic, teichoic acid) [Palleronia marisminoris]SLN70284.1 putative sugar transferase EpsL [Palleronia marisminoris]
MSDYVFAEGFASNPSRTEDTGESDIIAPEGGLYRNAGKTLMDKGFALLFGLTALPIVLVACALVALDGHSPFYAQKRVGRNGRVFKMWKIRTMVADADRKLAEYLEANSEAREEWTRYQKLRNDPRITRTGRILRKTSVDELPQFWNVLVGDMSVVGPRPMMVGQEKLYPGRSYYALKPGITGSWQISDRNNSSFADRARFDDIYLRETSLPHDLKIMVGTVRAVAGGTGC